MGKTPTPRAPQRLRMDKSKYFTTIHGERDPNDPHAGVHFFQDGLPFDAEGLLVLSAVPEDKQDIVSRRMAKLNGGKNAAPPVTQEQDGEDDEDDDNDDGGNPSANDGEVNLESWLRGEARYQWFAIVAAIRARFNKQVSNTTDAVTFLVEDEKVIQPSQLAPHLVVNYVPANG